MLRVEIKNNLNIPNFSNLINFKNKIVIEITNLKTNNILDIVIAFKPCYRLTIKS